MSPLVKVVRVLLVVVGVLPFVGPFLDPLLPGPLHSALEFFWDSVCHRTPSRAMTLLGRLMPICSRCGGIFAGLALAGAIARPRMTFAKTRLWLVITGLVMVADVVTQDLGWHRPWHPSRLGTGIALGYVMGIGLVSALWRVGGKGRETGGVAA